MIETCQFSFKTAFNVKETNDEFFTFLGAASISGVTANGFVFKKGAFKKVIAFLKKERTHLAMLFNHSREHIIGGFPTSSLKENEQGELLVSGEINMSVEKGKEVSALIKQGVLSDMSVGVGFLPGDLKNNEDSGVMEIKNVSYLDEISVVDIGANRGAKITKFNKNDLSSAHIKIARARLILCKMNLIQ